MSSLSRSISALSGRTRALIAGSSTCLETARDQTTEELELQSQMRNDIELVTMVTKMRDKDNKKKAQRLVEIAKQKTLTGKCIMARNYLSPQSTDFETICKKDLFIGDPTSKTSGDGQKNGVNYEIKTSIHANKSNINFVQIRPDHEVDYYLFIAYNMYETEDSSLTNFGRARIFKIPSNNVYDLIVRYGGYAHGTLGQLGTITPHNMTGRNCEYALRCDPNAKKGKSFDLWNEYIKYEVEYCPDNF